MISLATFDAEGALDCSEMSDDRMADENWLEGAPLAAGCDEVVADEDVPVETADPPGTSCPADGAVPVVVDPCAPISACIWE
jgi:hypothetical protein